MERQSFNASVRLRGVFTIVKYFNENSTLIVFDLDDTLYKEKDYKISGIKAVIDHICLVYDLDVVQNYDAAHLEEAETDWLSFICKDLQINEATKESLLWVYRLHAPIITMNENTKTLVDYLADRKRIAIITDGRSITQRLKIHALGLSKIPAYISEDFNASKPSTLMYNRVMEDIPAKRYCYIGDNPAKDFIAPNALGWTTVGVLDNGRNIHSQNNTSLCHDQKPHHWIDDIGDLLPLIG